MSTFRAEVVKIEVRRHPDADRLDIIKPIGKAWQCVDMRDKFKTGELAVYIPVDSVLPTALVAELGIEKYYSKRLKTVKLRGYFSQGLIAPLSILGPGPTPGHGEDGLDVTLRLGITKYEEVIPVEMAGIQRKADERFVKFTDIENFKNFPDVFTEGEPVVVSEKIHGSNARFANIDGELFVGSHNTNLQPPRNYTRWERLKALFGAKLPKTNNGNLYWRAAEYIDAKDQILSGEQVFAEIYGAGIQDLSYDMLPGRFGVSIIGVIRDGKYLDDAELDDYCEDRKFSRVPVVYRGPWKADLVALAGGTSTIAPSQIREGVVVTPAEEQFSERLGGRKIIKCISDEYLLRKDATERH